MMLKKKDSFSFHIMTRLFNLPFLGALRSLNWIGTAWIFESATWAGAEMPSPIKRVSTLLVRTIDSFMRDTLHWRIGARSLVFYYLAQVTF